MSLGYDLVGLALEPTCWHRAQCPARRGTLLWSLLIPTCFVHQATWGILVGNPLWDHPNPCPAPCLPLRANEKGRGPSDGSWPQRV